MLKRGSKTRVMRRRNLDDTRESQEKEEIKRERGS